MPSSPPPVSPGSSNFLPSSASVRICKHMNTDHPTSVLAIARNYCHREAKHASVIDVTYEGFVLSIDGIDEPKTALFPSKQKEVKDVRKMAVEMHESAFNELGLVYRLRHGYYKEKYKSFFKIYDDYKRCGIVVGLGFIGVGFMARRQRIRN
ncbi:hypothetical protein TrLO_g5216 [Triparma laevis f. longispina]|uniref:DUF2470 domain-containing protein n=1 Tax=Triparma laevis f. longispina TaxID=1714387 RepID=A0A9W7A3E4_9STRA|nr:hypothetical protein TrLO_g5216 [Triparma laevis f. longispina]